MRSCRVSRLIACRRYNGPGEIQINSPQMIYALKPGDARRILGDETYDAFASKPGMPEGGKNHKFYEDYRTSDDSVFKDKVAEESKAYYNAVRDAGGG